MRANADEPPLALDRTAGPRRPATAASNAGLGGSKPQARKLRSLAGCTLGSHHITAAAPVSIAGPEQCWQRNLPNSLVRTPLRFASEADRQLYRKGLRTLMLVYAGILGLVIVITGLRGEWRNQEVAATVSTVDIPRR